MEFKLAYKALLAGAKIKRDKWKAYNKLNIGKNGVRKNRMDGTPMQTSDDDRRLLMAMVDFLADEWEIVLSDKEIKEWMKNNPGLLEEMKDATLLDYTQLNPDSLKQINDFVITTASGEFTDLNAFEIEDWVINAESIDKSVDIKIKQFDNSTFLCPSSKYKDPCENCNNNPKNNPNASGNCYCALPALSNPIY